MANFKATPCAAAVLENTKLDFQSLYLRRIVSGPNKNQSTVIDGYGNTDFGLTSVNNWAIYDGAGQDAKLVARAKGMRMNAVDWCNFFTIVFEIERYAQRICIAFLSCSTYAIYINIIVITGSKAPRLR